jgi:hypothetical protein
VERAIQGLHKFSLPRVSENWALFLDDFETGNEVQAHFLHPHLPPHGLVEFLRIFEATSRCP